MAYLWQQGTAPFVALTYRGSQVELIMDGSNLCGPSATAPSGTMSVPVHYYDATAAGRTFQVTQFRHERCAPEGCPVRIFIINPAGSRGLLVNTTMPPLDMSDAGGARSRLHIARDGRTLVSGEQTFALDW